MAVRSIVVMQLEGDLLSAKPLMQEVSRTRGNASVRGLFSIRI